MALEFTMKFKVKRVLLLLLIAAAIIIGMFFINVAWDMAITLKENVIITNADAFPEWKQKDIDHFQQLTVVKLPTETVLLAYSSHYDGRRHDASWRIFSKEKIIFPWKLTKNIIPIEDEIDAFIKHCRARKAQANFSIEGDIQSCLASYKSYGGKGNDIFVEIKTSKGYYVRIDYCRTRRGPNDNMPPRGR